MHKVIDKDGKTICPTGPFRSVVHQTARVLSEIELHLPPEYRDFVRTWSKNVPQYDEYSLLYTSFAAVLDVFGYLIQYESVESITYTDFLARPHQPGDIFYHTYIVARGDDVCDESEIVVYEPEQYAKWETYYKSINHPLYTYLLDRDKPVVLNCFIKHPNQLDIGIPEYPHTVSIEYIGNIYTTPDYQTMFDIETR